MDCNTIEIDEGNWLKEKEFPSLYDSFLERYKSSLSHSHCPPHARRYERETNRTLRN